MNDNDEEDPVAAPFVCYSVASVEQSLHCIAKASSTKPYWKAGQKQTRRYFWRQYSAQIDILRPGRSTLHTLTNNHNLTSTTTGSIISIMAELDVERFYSRLRKLHGSFVKQK